MAPCRIVEDSDEDDEGLDISDLLSPSAASNEVAVNSMMQSSSTDPILFRAVYEEHIGQLLVDGQIPGDSQSPILDDPIFNQRMSSSLSIPSARKLKRSKTTNISSLSSITEPTLSNRKTLGTELTKAVDDLTQITTPRKSREATRSDPWEVPSSNDSDKPIGANVKLENRNSERNTSRKTYGRQIRRSQTVTYSMHSASYDQRLSSPMKDDNPHVEARKKSVLYQEEDPIESGSKQRKKARLDSREIFEALAEQLPDQVPITACSVPSDHANTSMESVLEKVPWNLSENVEIGTESLRSDFLQDLTSPSFTNQSITDALAEDSYPATKPLTTQASFPAARSIVIVPDVLSEEEKLQYDVISVASTVQSLRSSQSELITKMTSDEKVTEGSDASENFVPPFVLYSEMTQDPSHTTVLPSSLPVSSAKRNLRRAKSEVALKRIATQTENKVLKRKARSKTIGLNDKLPRREASIDELCVTSVEHAQRITSKGVPACKRKKLARCEEEENRMGNDELHDCEESGRGTDQYEPLSSLHRSRSISTQNTTYNPDHKSPRTKLDRKKSVKTQSTPENSITGDECFPGTKPRVDPIQLDAAVLKLPAEVVQEDCILLASGLTSYTVEETPSGAGKQADAPADDSVTSGPLQLKRRGRKKTSEIVAAMAVCVSNTHEDDSLPVQSLDHGVQRRVLHETDSNKQLLQETYITPPTKSPTTDAANNIPALTQTPDRDLKKSPEEHSPLQSGKVPYRIGLSKKTRIAPLLKMIRK